MDDYMFDYLDPIYRDYYQVQEGLMDETDFNQKYAHIKKDRIASVKLYINVQGMLGDVIVMARDQEMKSRTYYKLVEFTDFVVKSYYEKEKITFIKRGNQRMVIIAEGKLSYLKKDKPKLVRVISYGRKTIK